LGERFDEDPFLIFRLRGRTQEQVMQALRQRRAGGEEAVEEQVEEFETAIPLEESIYNFWDLGAPLEGFSVSIRPPVIEMPLLKRLGAASFVPEPGLEGYLRQVYETISQQAIKIAFRDVSEEK
jgi:uncharacterized Zn finger protein